MEFFKLWHESAFTTLGLFWMAFWAFGLGYLISSMIQVFVTRERMRKAMGEAGAKSVALGTFFGFISSSCSFAALATTRALFVKGAGLIPSLAFLLASTNLVIELGIVIGIFLGWQFIVGEYLGGILLILFMWFVVKNTASKNLIKKAREHAKEQTSSEKNGNEIPNVKKLIKSKEGWFDVAEQYLMEWGMVWKDVTIGFTIAGIIAVFVPKSFFQHLFVGAGTADPAFWQILIQTFIGPIAAFFTFIGSMGNIPLAAVLFSNGVSFAGIMAFIFSDLVVFPVLRIQAKYYGWKMALYILAVFLFILICTALVLHYGFASLNLLPDHSVARQITDRQFFQLDYTFFLNLTFILLSVVFLIWKFKKSSVSFEIGEPLIEKILFWLSVLAFTWLGVGVML